MRPTSTSVRARLASMPSGWNHHAGRPARRLGCGGRSRPCGPGRRLAELAAQGRPLPLGLAARDALLEDRRQQGAVEVAAGPGAHALPAVGGERHERVDVGHGGRRAVDARSWPSPTRVAQPAPGPHAATARSPRDQSRRTSAGPSGVHDARTNDARRRGAVVGSKRPWRYQPSVRGRSIGDVGSARAPRRGGADVDRHRSGTYQSAPATLADAARAARFGGGRGASGHDLSHYERDRVVPSAARRRAADDEPAGEAERPDRRAGHRPARRPRRHHGRSRRPRRRADRRRPRLLRRARPRRLRHAAAHRAPRPDAARVRRAAPDRQRHPAPAVAARSR